jgi:hypothetical protein
VFFERIFNFLDNLILLILGKFAPILALHLFLHHLLLLHHSSHLLLSLFQHGCLLRGHILSHMGSLPHLGLLLFGQRNMGTLSRMGSSVRLVVGLSSMGVARVLMLVTMLTLALVSLGVWAVGRMLFVFFFRGLHI